MHIENCLHPIHTYNRYTKERISVPCGHCEACLNNRSYRWIKKLQLERSCWKYCMFVTLTYDENYVPRLYRVGDTWCDLYHAHWRAGYASPHIEKGEFYSTLTDSQREFFNSRDCINVLSVYDVQCFIKRLRKNLSTLVNKVSTNFVIDSNKDEKRFRYYGIGEYGETTYRPHYHFLLFTNSEIFASYMEELLSKSWSFGICDSSFERTDAASYVARYTTSLGRLPSFYQVKSIRPFQVFSKSPAIGTLYADSATIRGIFDSAALESRVFDPRKGLFDAVPIAASVATRLFPKIPQYSSLSHCDRVLLYSYPARKETYEDFLTMCRQRIRQQPNDSTTAYIKARLATESGRRLWYRVSRRLKLQSEIFHVSMDRYVTQIERFWTNYEEERLKKKYSFMENYLARYPDKLADLINFDPWFLSEMADLELEQVRERDLQVMVSYGINVPRFWSDDVEERQCYRASLNVLHTQDMEQFAVDALKNYKDKMRTKVKNDYFEAHPELKDYALLQT